MASSLKGTCRVKVAHFTRKGRLSLCLSRETESDAWMTAGVVIPRAHTSHECEVPSASGEVLFSCSGATMRLSFCTTSQAVSTLCRLRRLGCGNRLSAAAIVPRCSPHLTEYSSLTCRSLQRLPSVLWKAGRCRLHVVCFASQLPKAEDLVKRITRGMLLLCRLLAKYHL